MKKIQGVFPVLCTPFSDNGDIVHKDFEAIIDYVLACGASGCVYPGVASEVETLTAIERRDLVALLGRRLDGRIPFIVGASDPDPDAVIDRIQEGADSGASVAMVIAPGNLGHDVAKHIAYFDKISKDTPLPVMLQNQPSPIGAGLTHQEIAEIATAIPAIQYVKEETLPCGQNLSLIKKAVGSAIVGVFGGAGARFLTDELARGALGTMPACELTDLHVELVEAWNSGNTGKARDLFRLTLPVLNFQAVFRVRATKHVLSRRGVIANTGARAKGMIPDQQDMRELDSLLDQLASSFSIFQLATSSRSGATRDVE